MKYTKNNKIINIQIFKAKEYQKKIQHISVGH